jgi:hypothetical protein
MAASTGIASFSAVRSTGIFSKQQNVSGSKAASAAYIPARVSSSILHFIWAQTYRMLLSVLSQRPVRKAGTEIS